MVGPVYDATRDEADGPGRLRGAIGAALAAASRAGRLEQSARSELEGTLAALDELLGSEPTRSSFALERRDDCCVVTVGGSAPVAVELVESFMDGAGARRLGTSRAWLLPLGGVQPTRWARALRRVIAAERRGRDPGGSDLPLTLTFAWARDDQLVVATVE